jgi:predicted DNA-binding protein (UPF0278 family)
MASVEGIETWSEKAIETVVEVVYQNFLEHHKNTAKPGTPKLFDQVYPAKIYNAVVERIRKGIESGEVVQEHTPQKSFSEKAVESIAEAVYQDFLDHHKKTAKPGTLMLIENEYPTQICNAIVNRLLKGMKDGEIAKE